MQKIKINSQIYELDEFGYLCDINSWNKSFAIGMAKNQNIDLKKYPVIFNAIKNLHNRYKLGKYIFRLGCFNASREQCRQFAGLPKPKSISEEITEFLLLASGEQKRITNFYEYRFDDGWLDQFSTESWTPYIATLMAADDKLILSKQHWEIIIIIREYMSEYEIFPSINALTRILEKKIVLEDKLKYGVFSRISIFRRMLDKKRARDKLYRLFPSIKRLNQYSGSGRPFN